MWILEKIYLLRTDTEKFMEKYKINFAARAVVDFVEELANWYVKLNRDRMKGLHGNDEWVTSLHVLYTVLYEYLVISAPCIPFLTEHIYQHLIDPKNRKESIHLEKYPTLQCCFRFHHFAEKLCGGSLLSDLVRLCRRTTGHCYFSPFGKRLIQLPLAVIFWMYDVGRLSFIRVLLFFVCAGRGFLLPGYTTSSVGSAALRTLYCSFLMSEPTSRTHQGGRRTTIVLRASHVGRLSRRDFSILCGTCAALSKSSSDK